MRMRERETMSKNERDGEAEKGDKERDKRRGSQERKPRPATTSQRCLPAPPWPGVAAAAQARTRLGNGESRCLK